MGTNNWFIVINRSSAKIFEIARRPNALHWLETISSPLQEVVSLSPRSDRRPHRIPPLDQTTAEEIAHRFVKKISEYLVHKKLDRNFLGLTIAAEPHMKGLIRRALEKARVKIAIRWLEKDIKMLPTYRLEEILFGG